VSTLPTITDASGLTVNGQKAEIAVSGRGTHRPFEVSPGASLALNHLTVTHGSAHGGGGLANTGGTVRVSNSTFSGNGATNVGGGILNSGTLTVTNSTFSGNAVAGAARSFGGAIYNSGTLTVTNSTFSENGALGSGGGIYNGGTATLRNTIVANSTSGGNCGGLPITDGGYNIEDGTSCGFSEANNSMPSTEPELADDLADNGGPTQTIALLKGSPAINTIPKTENGCGTEVTTDQRGVNRPQGKKCDTGAFERKVRRR
jgi:hypothetical protein